MGTIKTQETKAVGNEKPTKSGKAEVNSRVAEIQSLLLSGYTRSYIQEYGEKWQLSERQVDTYIAQATAIIREVNLATLADNQGIIVGQLWSLFREARTLGNISEQHKLLLSIARLKGIDQQTIDLVIKDKRELADLSDAALDEILTQHANH